MKKLKLSTDYNYDFQLYGIISGAKEYTLSWAINFYSSIALKKEKDIELDIKGLGHVSVSNYKHVSDTSTIYLIQNLLDKNQHVSQKLFVPSMNDFDYILKVETHEDFSVLDNFFLSIRKSDKIQSIVKLDVEKIKEKEYFLF